MLLVPMKFELNVTGCRLVTCIMCTDDSGEYQSPVTDERKNTAKNHFISDFCQIWSTGSL